MARLHDISDEELPDLSTFLGISGNIPVKKSSGITGSTVRNDDIANDGTVKEEVNTRRRLKDVTPASCGDVVGKSQRPLRVHLTAMSDNIPSRRLPGTRKKDFEKSFRVDVGDMRLPPRASPKRATRKAVYYREPVLSSDMQKDDVVSDSDSAGSLVEFVVDDDYISYEDSEVEAKESRRNKKRLYKKWLSQRTSTRVSEEALLSTNSPKSSIVLPKKNQQESQLDTPPASPPRSPRKLKSPTKQQRIPQSPHRPSIDAFWSQELIDSWNEQYSPKKPSLTSSAPKETIVLSDPDDVKISKSSPSKTPKKKSRQALEAKKCFEKTKHEVAQAFLHELDTEVGKGRLAEMTASTGGVKLIWSKKLNTTAGRAYWKREVVKRREASGDYSSQTHRHVASIELSEKVIDDEGQ